MGRPSGLHQVAAAVTVTKSVIMSRSPLRRSVVLICALALLTVGLMFWNHFQPGKSSKEPVSLNQQNENATSPPVAEREVAANDLPAIQPVPILSQSNVLVRVEAANYPPVQAEVLYRVLQESNDPQEKRNIRKQLAALKPAEVPFRFALAKYGSANSEEEKLHLQSILGQIDVSDLVHEVAVIASQTQDESLFVSLAYALRNSTNILARQELLKLAANNHLPIVRTNSLMANQGLVALHRCLLDSLQPSDLAWINEYQQTNPLNPVQERILADFVAKTERAMHKP